MKITLEHIRQIIREELETPRQRRARRSASKSSKKDQKDLTFKYDPSKDPIKVGSKVRAYAFDDEYYALDGGTNLEKNIDFIEGEVVRIIKSKKPKYVIRIELESGPPGPTTDQITRFKKGKELRVPVNGTKVPKHNIHNPEGVLNTVIPIKDYFKGTGRTIDDARRALAAKRKQQAAARVANIEVDTTNPKKLFSSLPTGLKGEKTGDARNGQFTVNISGPRNDLKTWFIKSYPDKADSFERNVIG